MTKMKIFKGLIVAAAASALVACGSTPQKPAEKKADVAVKITPKMASATVNLNGSDVTIIRESGLCQNLT